MTHGRPFFMKASAKPTGCNMKPLYSSGQNHAITLWSMFAFRGGGGIAFQEIGFRAKSCATGDQSQAITGGAVANRLRRRTSDQTVLGSNPAVAAALSPWTRLFTPIVPRRSLHISFY